LFFFFAISKETNKQLGKKAYLNAFCNIAIPDVCTSFHHTHDVLCDLYLGRLKNDSL